MSRLCALIGLTAPEGVLLGGGGLQGVAYPSWNTGDVPLCPWPELPCPTLVPLVNGWPIIGFACRDAERNPAAAATSGVAADLANAADGGWRFCLLLSSCLRR